jgi:hypothetical protein
MHPLEQFQLNSSAHPVRVARSDSWLVLLHDGFYITEIVRPNVDTPKCQDFAQQGQRSENEQYRDVCNGKS